MPSSNRRPTPIIRENSAPAAAGKEKFPVCESDLKYLRARGIRDETIYTNQLRTEHRALIFPYRDLLNNVNCFMRWRPHTPRIVDGKPAKFDQTPETKVRAYFPAGCINKLLDGHSTVFITEGEVKALALSQLKIAAVGISGVWCGCNKGTTVLLDDLAAISWKDRTVFIVFDFDDTPTTRKNVDNARRRLAGAFRKIGAKVVHLHLPGSNTKVGVDDFLVANGPDAFFKLVESTESKTRTRFTASELMKMNLPEPQCLVKDIITDGLNLLVSRPKLGKSWFVLQLSIATATGGKFFGYDIEPGDVLYLALEDNPRRLKKRLAKLLGDNPAPERLTICTSWARMDEGGKEAIQQWIDEAEDPKLIIIDTLAKVKKRAKKCGDRYADDYLDVSEFKELADDNEVPHLLNHHDRKAQSTDIMDDVSGTIGITGSADTILLLKRQRGQHDACLHVTGRDIDDSEIALGWDADACRWSILGEADQLSMSGQRQDILKALQGGPKTIKGVAETTGMKEGNVKQLLHKMKNDDQVKSTSGVYELVSRPFGPKPVEGDNPDNSITPSYQAFVQEAITPITR